MPDRVPPNPQRPTQLADELRDLGRSVPTPGTDLTDAVMARVLTEPVPAPQGRITTTTTWVRAHWRAFLAGLAAVVVVLLLTPPVRATVAEWFRFGGVLVDSGAERGPSSAPPYSAPPPPAATGSTLDEARRLVRFTPVLPRKLGQPDGVAVSPDRRVLSMTWRTDDGVLRVDEFDGRIEPAFLKSSADVEYVTVGTGPALWFPEPHQVVVLAPDGRTHQEPPRLAGHTLIWEYDGVTLRMEGDISRDRSVTIAESSMPIR